MKHTNTILCLAAILFLGYAKLFAQVNYTANTVVPPYNAPMKMGVNNGYYANFVNQQLAELAGGNLVTGAPGAGGTSMRVGFSAELAELFGDDILLDLFEYYGKLGMDNHTLIVGNPVDWQRDSFNYCTGKRSVLFKNIYLPVWDGGANGTPYNDENYWAAHVYKMVTLYKPYVKFYEIWNEPGFDNSGSQGWLTPNQPNNWWTNDPSPCANILQAPVQHYVRTLRVAYEVIKTVDPQAYVTFSGIGYPSFLDAVLRNTDNPTNGSVTSAYPLKGGAYFDAVGFHAYPHFDGSTRVWDNALGAFVYSRHSDGAADGMIRIWGNYKTLLNNYGYNGTTYPKKVEVITEGNVPAKAFSPDGTTANEQFGGIEAQRNFIIKAMVNLYKNNIVRFDVFEIFNRTTMAAATGAYDVMGLYEKPATPTATPVRTGEGIAYETVSNLLSNTTYDATKTASLNLPNTVQGGAFLNPNGKYIYVLWAKTLTDRSESANATYSFPSSISNLTRRAWDFSQTSATSSSNGQNLQLTGAPLFFTDDAAWPPSTVITAPKTDLALQLTANPVTPTAGQNVIWTLTITNTSAVNATNVKVGNYMEFGKQFLKDRLTYVSHTADAGTSHDVQKGVWTIPSLAVGQTKTLQIITTALHNGPYKAFAQVTNCSQPDSDSAPLNGHVRKLVFEDDEAVFTINDNGFLDTKPDLVAEATTYPSSAAAGSSFYTTYMIRNNGRLGSAAGSMKIFLSTDRAISANDVDLGTESIPALNSSAYKTVKKLLTIPSATTSGNYFLLYVADVTNTTDEFDENNTFARDITITGGGVINPPGTYCASKSVAPWVDWIGAVKVGTLEKTSSKSTYSNFTTTIFQGNNGTPMELTTKYSYYTFNEYWRVWIDLNGDGDFTDTGEKVFEGVKNRPADGVLTTILNGSITLPAGVSTGNKRMRVSMKRNSYAEPCETFPEGEVEDYTINITGGGGGNPCSPDVTAPVLSNCPSNQQLTAPSGTTTAVATWSAPTATDNCPGTVNLSSTHASGTGFSIGTTIVAYTATDQASNTKTCSFTITVSSGGGGSACSGNQLQNPGFESDLASWSNSGGTISTIAASGAKSVQLCASNNSVKQTRPATVGRTYLLQADVRKDAAATGTLRIKFMNASFSPLAVHTANISSSAYSTLSLNRIAPANTAFIEVSVVKTNASGCLNADNMCLSEAVTNLVQSNGTSADLLENLDSFEEPYTIFPNPAGEIIWISIPPTQLEGKTTVSLVNPLGQLVKQASFTTAPIDQTISMDVTDLLPGLYFVRMENGVNRSSAKRLVIEHNY